MDIELINTTRNDIRDIFVDNIALIRLTTAINTTGIHAAKLVNDNTKLWPNMPLVMAGWGHTEKCIQRLSKRLKKSSTILQPEQVCKKMSKHFNKRWMLIVDIAIVLIVFHPAIYALEMRTQMLVWAIRVDLCWLKVLIQKRILLLESHLMEEEASAAGMRWLIVVNKSINFIVHE